MNCINKFKAFIIFCVTFYSMQVFSQDLISQAWGKVNECKLEEALEIFLNDANQSNNYNSFLAASYIEELLLEYDKAYLYFSKALDLIPNKEPYLVAGLHSARVIGAETNYLNFIQLMKDVVNTTSDGFVKTYFCEKIGKYYEGIAQLDKAKDYYSQMGSIKTWSIIGPFENISSSGFHQEYLPEKSFDQDRIYTGKENKKIKWFEPKKYRIDGWVDYLNYFPDTNSIYYANTFIHSNKRQVIQIRIGTSGSLRAFLNDKMIFESYTETNNNSDTYIAQTYLEEGWNRLLIKVGYSEIDYCNFLIRITDERGFEKPDLEFSNLTQKYSTKINSEVKTIKSNIEKFFEDKLNQDSENPVNYLLLGEAYAINHKSTEAQSIYIEGMRKFPDNVLFPFHLAGNYMRNNKTSMFYSLMDKVDKIRDDIPLLIDAKLNREIKTQNKQNFISLYEKYYEKLPDYEGNEYYSILYNAYQNKPVEMTRILNSSYEKYPNNFEIVSIKANLEYSLSRDFKSAIGIIEKYNRNNFNSEALKATANLYLATSDIKAWETTYEKLLSYKPSDPDIYFDIAYKYYELQDYESSIKYINEAIAISPYNSYYFYFLGLCKNAIGNTKECEEALLNSLNASAFNYSARDLLEKINKDYGIVEGMNEIDIKSAINSAPTIKDYPSDDVVVLEKNILNRIYSGGASETKEEALVKILTDDGVEWYNNTGISYYANQSLIIDKAYTIKTDGTEIQAEINGSQLVYKSLEKNDYVYYKYRILNNNSGLLNEYFWTTQVFSSYDPVEKMKYSVILPKDMNLIIRSNNMSDQPSSTSDVGPYKLLVWERNKVPAIEYEYYMPELSDVGENLYLSTINDWNLVAKWYYDLTRSKIIEHYEIKNKVAAIFKGKNDLSEKQKVKRIYEYIAKEISYVYVPFLQSEFVPQKASDVLVNKMGDCKDVVTLFIAMLKEIGINADYVLLRTQEEGKNYNSPPGMYFNHVIAVTYLNGEKQYYDLTASDYPCFTIPESLNETLALEIRNDVYEPFYLKSGNLSDNKVLRNTTLIINEDNTAKMEIVSNKYGESAVSMRSLYKNISKEQRDKKLTEILANDMSDFSLISFDIKDLDSLTIETNYKIDVMFNNFINKSGNYRMFKIPWNDELSQNPALSYPQRAYPYLMYSQADEFEKMEIKLPEGFVPVEIPDNLTISCPNAECRMSFTLKSGKIIAEREFKLLNKTVTTENYKTYKDFYNKIIEKENNQILLKPIK